jgi:hypothetical protein
MLGGTKKPLVPQKVFSQPFRLMFEKPSGEVTWIEVRSLKGFHEVLRRVRDGEVFVKDGFTMELQLWAILAEHIGFLRVQSGNTSFSLGLQPFGEGAVALSEDLAELCGSEDAGIQLLAEMQRSVRTEVDSRLRRERESSGPNPLVKEDGVNLTPEGEEHLAKILGEPLTPLKREQDAGVDLFQKTEPEDPSVDEIMQDESVPAEGEIRTGEDVAEIGRRVEEAAKGELREEEDEPKSD